MAREDHYVCKDCANRTCEEPVWYNGPHKGEPCGDMNCFYKFVPKRTTADKKDDIGTAESSPHYNSLPVQPIELMETILTPEEFQGFLKGNMLKYVMRAGRKANEDSTKDTNKFNQYKEWYIMAINGHSVGASLK